jgi:hypothetical protein
MKKNLPLQWRSSAWVALGAALATACGGTAGEPEATASDETIDVQESALSGATEGNYVLRSEVGTNMCLDVQWGNPASGTPLHLWPCNEGPAQHWILTDAGGAFGTLRSALGNVADVASSANAAPVRIQTPVGSAAQRWTFEPAGDGAVFVRSGLGNYLEVAGGSSASGTAIVASQRTGAVAQRWRLVPRHNSVLEKRATAFFALPKAPGSSGDNDFGGNGPNVNVTVTINIRNSNEVWARIWMRARETKSDWTTAEGTNEQLIYRAPAGTTIRRIISTTSSGLAYTDTDHADDYVMPVLGEQSTAAQDSNWQLPTVPGALTPLVHFARVVGDTDGSDIGRTGLQVFFNPILLDTSTPLPAPRILPNAFSPVSTCGANTCGSSSGVNFLQLSGRNMTCERFRDALTSRGNIIPQWGLGVPPGTLADQIRDFGVTARHAPASSTALFTTVRSDILLGRPVIVMGGWGSRAVRDTFLPFNDTISANPNSTLHYVVVNGINDDQQLVHVLDNGTPKVWSRQYLESFAFFRAEPHTELALRAVNAWPPGSLVRR